jgi:hypothetical protein
MKTTLALCLTLLGSALGLRAACVEIICPADIITGCQSASGAVVNFAPEASTTCGTSITVTCMPPSGSVFSIGTNSVQCSVTDPRGNIARCEFRVIVTNGPPKIVCPSDIVTNCNSFAGIVVNFAPVVDAPCATTVNVECVPPSGSAFPVGTNWVQCAVTDDRDRTARCAFEIIVTNAPPTIYCPRDMLLEANATCRAVLPVIPVSVIERCTPTNQLVFSQSPVAGTLLWLGDHAVTVTVSEGPHNDVSCTLTVHVVDTTGPQIKCPGQVLAHCAPEGTDVFFKVDATDNCDPAVTVICEPPSGSFFPPGGTTVTCIAQDSAGNTNQCAFGVNVLAGPPTLKYVAGSKDNYALPADATSKSACLVTAMTGVPTISQFDQNFAGRWLGHSFENLPGGIEWASLRLRMKPKGNVSSNDVLRIGLTDCAAGAQWAWSQPIKSLPVMGGIWTTNGDTHITLDLAAMPGNPASLLPLLGLETSHRLDIAIGEDTVVDWIELSIKTCQSSGAAGGIPYMLKQGIALPGPDESIEFSSDERGPFDVDLHFGKADGIEIELGDDWPVATNPPISECTTPVGSLDPMKLEWKPDGKLLCTVHFMFDIAPPFTDVLLTQPTNIIGGRAIEVWRDGQMVSRYFHEEGSGPIDASGVVLPDEACLLSMGFGQGEFFMALKEPVPVSFAFAKHISGEESPVSGDFIRVFFNIPMTVAGDGGVRFDPDIVLNIQGERLDVRGMKLRKFGAWWEGIGSEAMTVSDGLVVAPGNDIFGACFEAAPAYGSESYSEPVMLSMSELLNCQGCGPGTVFTIEATAERMSIPPERKTIGTMTCEILTTNPLKTRFTADYTYVGSSTEVLVFFYGSDGFDFDTFPSNQVVEVDGAPEAIELFIANTAAKFGLKFANPPGGTAMVDGVPYSAVHTISFGPRGPISAHEAPYKFCISAVQKIPLELFPVRPSAPPPPAPGNCVTMTCPTNVLARCQSAEGAVVNFDVTARTSCGSNLTVVCVPPSGSLFPPGITDVGCQASDNLGYAASCRFPVTVAGDCASERQWFPLLNDAAEGTPIVIDVLRATSAETELEITVPGFWTTTEIYGGREFVSIQFPEAEVRGAGYPSRAGERGWFDFPERQNQIRRNASRFTRSAAINCVRPGFPESAVGEMPTTAAEMVRLGIDPRGAQPGLCGVGFSLAASPLNTLADLSVSTVASEHVRQVFGQALLPAGFQGQDAVAPVSQGYTPPELLDQTYYSGPGALGDLTPVLAAPRSAGRLANLPLRQPLFRLTSLTAGEFVAKTRLHVSHAKGTEDFARRPAWDAWMGMPRFINGAGVVDSLIIKGFEPLAVRQAHYLILTPQATRPALEEFAQWKRKKGLHVNFAIVREMLGGEGDVDADRDAIDAYIENYYAQHAEEGVFVLLVGDVDILPSGHNTATTGPDYLDADSDHVYEALGDSILPAPGLSVGRLSCNRGTELQTQLNKILTYERSPAVGDWPQRATLCANKQDYPLKYTAAVLGIWDYDYFVDPPTFNLLLAGSPDPDFIGTTPRLVEEINDGRGWILYRGHGGSESWGNGWDAGGDEFDPDDVMLLNNSVTPIVASIACQTGRIKYDDCLGERLMAHPQGAVAFYGATLNTHTEENHVRAKALFRAVYEFGEQHLGRALNLVDELSEQPGWGVFDWWDNVYSYLLLGDPEMTIRRKPVLAGLVNVEIGPSEVGGGTILVVSNKDREPQPGFFVNITLPNGVQTNGFTGPNGTLFLEGVSPEKVISLDVMGDGVWPAFLVLNPPTLTPLGFEPDGFGVMLHGIAGGHYEIEGSSDLTHWSSVGAGVAGSDGSLHIVDPSATTSSHRFYRARVAP